MASYFRPALENAKSCNHACNVSNSNLVHWWTKRTNMEYPYAICASSKIESLKWRRLKTTSSKMKGFAPLLMTMNVEPLSFTVTKMPPENYKFGCKKPKSVRWWWTFWASFWGSLEPLWPSDYSSFSCGKYSQLFMIAGIKSSIAAEILLFWLVSRANSQPTNQRSIFCFVFEYNWEFNGKLFMIAGNLPGSKRNACWPSGIPEKIPFSSRRHLPSRTQLTPGDES